MRLAFGRKRLERQTHKLRNSNYAREFGPGGSPSGQYAPEFECLQYIVVSGCPGIEESYYQCLHP